MSVLNYKKNIGILLSLTLTLTMIPFQAIALQPASIDLQEETTRLIVVHDDFKDIEDIANDESLDVLSSEKIFEEDGEAISVVSVEDSIDDAINNLEDSGNVIKVVEDAEFSLDTTVNDPYTDYNHSYYLDNENIKDAWDVHKTEGDVTVAVLDSGVTMDPSYRYEDMSSDVVDYDNAWDNRVNQKRNTTYNRKLSSSYIDYQGHGTAVSHIISAEANNAIGLAGVSYNAKILPIVVVDEDGSGSVSSLIYAYNYIISKANDLNIKVVNMSLGSLEYEEAYELLEDVITTAKEEYGIITISSAGNENSSEKSYPASLDNVISVAAVNKNRNKCSFSNYNESVDLCASGQSLYLPSMWSSEYNNGKLTYTKNDDNNLYEYQSGTSFSCPIVSGIAALMYSKNHELTPDQVESILEDTSRDLGELGKDNNFGYGQVDACKAIQKVESLQNTTSTITYSCDGVQDVTDVNYEYASTITLPDGVERKDDVSVYTKSNEIKFYLDGELYDTKNISYSYTETDSYNFSGWFINENNEYNLIGKPGDQYNIGKNKHIYLYGKYDLSRSMSNMTYNSILLPTVYGRDDFKGWYLGDELIGFSGEYWTPNSTEPIIVCGEFEKTHSFDASLKEDSFVYNGGSITPDIIAKFDGKEVIPALNYSNNIEAGNANVLVSYSYEGIVYKKSLNFKITKANNPMRVKKLKKNKIDRKKISIYKLLKIRNARGSVSFKKISGSKYLSFNKKNILIKKSNKVLKIKLRIKANGSNNFKSKSKIVTLKIFT